MTRWWSTEPVLFTQRDYEGHRLRLVIAEKRARCLTKIIDRLNPAPDYLAEVNPDNIFPVLIDKHLICYGPALDELLHERYPGPALLPNDPINRARLRMLADKVRSWYGMRPNELADHLMEVAGVYTGSQYFAGSAISIVDIALIPLMYEVPEKFLSEAPEQFLNYRHRLLVRPSFRLSIKPYVPPNDIIDEDDEVDDLLEGDPEQDAHVA